MTIICNKALEYFSPQKFCQVPFAICHDSPTSRLQLHCAYFIPCSSHGVRVGHAAQPSSNSLRSKQNGSAHCWQHCPLRAGVGISKEKYVKKWILSNHFFNCEETKWCVQQQQKTAFHICAYEMHLTCNHRRSYTGGLPEIPDIKYTFWCDSS